MRFCESAGKKFFYSVPKNVVTILEDEEVRAALLEEITLYEEPECVLCLCEASEVIFVPCGHFCTCAECNDRLKKRECPLCRTAITTTARKDEL